MNKEVKQIVEMFHPCFSVEPGSGKGHWVVTKGGFPYRAENGQLVTLPSSPARSERMNLIKGLERVGVISRGQPLPRQVEGARRERKPGGERLARTDTRHVDHTNTLATNKLRESLKDLGVWALMLRPATRSDVATAAAFVSDADVMSCQQIIRRITDGWTLVPADREPLEDLEGKLSLHSDPIRMLYQLVRSAKGLIGREESEPPAKEEPASTTAKEEPVSTQVQEAKLVGAAAQVTIQFIEQLEKQKDEMLTQIGSLQEQVEGIDQLIGQVRNLVGGGNTNPVDDTDTHHRSHDIDLTDDKNDDGNDGDSNGGTQAIMDNVMELVANGGEWTQREMYETLDVTQSTMSMVVRQLVEAGKLVMVEPGRGPNPSTYGSSEFYSKQD